MKITHKILVVEHDAEFGESVKQLLESEMMEVSHVTKVTDAMSALMSEQFDLIISDLKLSGPTGLDLLRKVRAEKLEVPVIIMTSYTSIKCAAQALRLGAADYILKPFTDSYLMHAVARGLKEKSIEKENTLLRRNLSAALHTKQEIIGESHSIRELKNLINRVGPSEATVLIQGESGTGKELVALGIHKASTRSEGRFVPVNCGAIPVELMESEFFGHVKGAFTGAIASKIGLIQEAHGGTLFLDEIAELAPMLQVKLLRFIQDKMIKPVGDAKEHEVDVRIIAACNRDLQKEVNEGRMREDLFYRLNVIQISVPPLRQRLDDIELLTKYFIVFYNARLGRKITNISDDALAFLKEYEWPGNIRELENSIERAVILAKDDELKVVDFEHIKTNGVHKQSSSEKEAPLLGPMSIEDYTRQIIQQYQNDYNEIELAKLLGIGRKALWMRRNRWGLFRDRQKSAVEF
jgi:DNA-binding NtrC family response regulator